MPEATRHIPAEWRRRTDEGQRMMDEARHTAVNLQTAICERCGIDLSSGADCAVEVGPCLGSEGEMRKLPEHLRWRGEGPEPPQWTAPCGTIVYRSYSDYVFD